MYACVQDFEFADCKQLNIPPPALSLQRLRQSSDELQRPVMSRLVLPKCHSLRQHQVARCQVMRFLEGLINGFDYVQLRSYRTIKIATAITDFRHLLSNAVCLLWATVEACRYNMVDSMEEVPVSIEINTSFLFNATILNANNY